MSDNQWSSMSEKDFELMLRNGVPEVPPNDISEDVTPWKKAMNRVLVGMAFCAITLEFWCLNYILPAIGIVLSLLGFRALRRENRWFFACYVITIIRAAYFFPMLILNTTVVFDDLFTASVGTAFLGANIILMLAGFICLWKGLRAVQIKAGMTPGAGAAVGLVVWYVVMCVLAAVQYEGLIIGIGMIISYICIIRSLYKLSGELDEAGYSVQAAPVRVTDKALVISIAAIVVTGGALGYIFGSSYNMDWCEVQPSEQANSEEIRNHLTELGFPEYVLNDLTTEDIAACDGALRVVVDIDDKAMNDGRRVITKTGDGKIVEDTVYDVKDLRITGIAVQVPGEREKWIIFHHFLWLKNPGFCGTESIQLWPTYVDLPEGWMPDGEVSGRVLYDSDGITFAAPYHSIKGETYYDESFFWQNRTNNNISADFSLPKNGENCRGYVAYSVSELADDYIISSRIDYTHQQSLLQYPAMTAREYRKQGIWGNGVAFRTVQDAIQFYPTLEEPEAWR